MNNTMKQISEIAVGIDHVDAFDGKSKGNRHLFRIVEIAKYLAKELDADIEVAEAGAWLHDTALPSGNDYDYDTNKIIVTKIMDDVELNKKVKMEIAECVASHEGTREPETIEAKIVHDADVLEKTGLLGLIRHTWKMTNSGLINSEDVLEKDVKAVVDHVAWRRSVLHTDAARNLSDILSIEIDFNKAKKIVELSSKLAYQGVITEKIAEKIEEFLSKDEIKLLRNQLRQDYLKNI